MAAPVREFPGRNFIAVTPNISVVRRIAPARSPRREHHFCRSERFLLLKSVILAYFRR